MDQGAAGHPMPRLGFWRALTHPTTVLSVMLAACLTLGTWTVAERPVEVPDFRGSVGGLAFSPFHRGQSPETQAWPTKPEIKSDLAYAADMTDQVRTYTVQGVFADIPRLARALPLRVTLGAWLDRDLAGDRRETDRLVEVAHANRNVDRVLIGNEAVLRGDLTTAQLIGLIDIARRGLHVPVSTAEPWHVWLEHPELAARGGLHHHPPAALLGGPGGG